MFFGLTFAARIKVMLFCVVMIILILFVEKLRQKKDKEAKR